MSDNVIQFPVSTNQRAQNSADMMYHLLPSGLQHIVDEQLELFIDAPSIKSRIQHLRRSIVQTEGLLSDMRNQTKGLDIMPEDVRNTIADLENQLRVKIASILLLESKLKLMGGSNA